MRIAAGIEYTGQPYHGWQAQQGLATIQGELETALSKIADAPIALTCAGRTDAGVNATGQVVHFDTLVHRENRAWVLGTNSQLPSDIAIKWVQLVDDHFHARFSALSRRYCYVIYNDPVRPGLGRNQSTWYHYPLDIELMREAAPCLMGEQDFSSFRSAECMSTTPMRNMMEISISRQHQWVIIEIEANAFLHHMVRNIVGTLLPIGSGIKSPQWMQEVLYAKDRRVAGETAPATGLYLRSVNYPKKYIFPASNPLILI